MNDRVVTHLPTALEAIHRNSTAIGFTMASEPQTGSIVRTLAAAKPGGRFLELGTGTVIATAWLLDGMDAGSLLDSVDNDAVAMAVAKRHLGGDRRAAWHVMDGAEFLAQSPPSRFDFIFADAWPGKFTHLDLALSRLRHGGIYLIDDLLPQANWPDNHPAKVAALVAELDNRVGFVGTKLAWASGLMILVRVGSDS